MTLEKLKEILVSKQKKRKKFNVSIWLKIRYLFCSKTLNDNELFSMKTLEKCEDIVIKKMDMISYLKFIQEYIHVKCILFEDVHSLCLSHIQKPKVYEDNRFVKVHSDEYIKAMDIISFFKSRNIMTKMDDKIYEILSKDLKKMIKNY